MASKACGEMTYLFQNFNGATVEVWEWIKMSSNTLLGLWFHAKIKDKMWSRGCPLRTSQNDRPLQWRHIERDGVSNHLRLDCSDADQRKHQSSASLAFVRGIHRWPVNSPYKGPVTREMFPSDHVIMIFQTTFSRNFPELDFLFCFSQIPLEFLPSI